MCGIAGIWCRDGENPEVLSIGIDNMLTALAHRGPDDGGYMVDSHVALGNRRLSIFDLSAAGNQPFFSDDGQLSLVFNGEIYNHIELRRELEAEFVFRSKTDTEVLLRAFEKWGVACLDRFNGMFAFAIWDSANQMLTLCRDRIGIKPLYYYYDGRSLYFASEIKAILTAGVIADPYLPVIHDYLIDGFYDHTNLSFFKDIKQVKQGCYLQISSSGKSEHNYWDLLGGLGKHNDSAEELEEHYWHTLKDSVQLRMRADVPYGVMFSGGLDSSVIAELAQMNISQGVLNTLTFRHNESHYAVEPWIDEILRSRNWINHTVHLTEEDVTKLFVSALWHQDEPFGSVATIADVILASMARDKGIYVLLEGQGADETLGGYEYYYSYYLADLAERNEKHARDVHRLYSKVRGIADEQINLSYSQLLSIGNKVNGGIGQDGTRTTNQKGLDSGFNAIQGTGFTLPVAFGTRFENVLYRDLKQTKVPRVLRFKDKASMMFGVELRVPFLDHRLVELAFCIPPERKLAQGFTKNCLRQRMLNILPRQAVQGVKAAVQTPQREWLRGALRPMVEDVLYSRSFAQRGIFSAPDAQEIYKDYLVNPMNYPNLFFIWQWLCLEWWYRLFVDQTVQTESQWKWSMSGNQRRQPVIRSLNNL